MKKINLLMAITFLMLSLGFAQEGAESTSRDILHFGGKIGANYSSVYSTEGESFDTESKFGLAAGVFLTIPISTILGIQPEVLFSQKGYKANGNLLGSSYEITRTSNYIDVPLMVSIKPLEELTFLAGPQYSFLLSQRNKFENSKTTIAQENEFDNENLRKNTLCFTGGIDLNIDRTVFSVRVGWDLFKNNGDGTTTTPRYKNSWTQLTVGYRL